MGTQIMCTALLTYSDPREQASSRANSNGYLLGHGGKSHTRF